jgi:mannitol-1-phosphate 5-dehydrogenase
VGSRTFVGFGFGAIQAGLFLYEAFHSGNFQRLVVAEVLPDVVAALRRAEGWYSVNVAHADRVEAARIGPVEICNPAEESHRQRLVEAVAQAEEIATAVPSVQFYVSEGPGSIHRILAAGLRRKAEAGGPRAVIYAAENHNHAAEILQEAVLSEIPETVRDATGLRVQFLNTVIGKMSGVVSDPAEVEAQGLATVTAEDRRAFLVEAFNRILISKIHFPQIAGEAPFRRGITVFEEKDDLLPFEEAKLYGHNATHALAAYVSAVRGLQLISDLHHHPDVFHFLRAAMLEESGKALVRKHAGVDALFTREGFRAYTDDLLARMINPYLRDRVERVGRDPARKLGWDDRLVGTMRLALREGVTPRRYAFGVAAALAALDRSFLESGAPVGEWLNPLWTQASPPEAEKQAVLVLVGAARSRLRSWRQGGFPNLEDFLQKER